MLGKIHVTPPPKDEWAAERRDVLERFMAELSKATGDGSKKRQSGEKPAWWIDKSHEAAMFSHLNKWKHGEKADKDSGAHPLVHLAWRALAIACSESGNHPIADKELIAKKLEFEKIKSEYNARARAIGACEL